MDRGVNITQKLSPPEKSCVCTKTSVESAGVAFKFCIML